jgi:hypothetical protein
MDQDSSRPTNDTDFIKVRNFLSIDRRTDITSDGLHFSQEFKDRLSDIDELVRSKIIIPINEKVGLHNWAVTFVQNSSQFFCDIYSSDKTHFDMIVSIISNRLTDMDIELFEHKGTISDYKNNK